MGTTLRALQPITIGLICMLTACERNLPIAPMPEPAVWRTYTAVRIDDLYLPFVWAVGPADTTRLVEQRVELRVDGTTAWRAAYLRSITPDTLRTEAYTTHEVFGDSLRIGSLRYALSDTVLVIPERIGPGRYWHYRRLPDPAVP